MRDYQYFTGTLKNGKISPEGAKKDLIKDFAKNYEGSKIRVYIEVVGKEKSLASLAKIHAMIREIANETGHTPEEIKNLIKERAGYITDPEVSFSLKDADVKEMSDLINVTYDLADYLGVNLF